MLDPATGEVIGEVASSGPEDVDAALAAAADAFGAWSRTTPRERSEALLALAAAVEDNIDELKRLEMQNVGKPVSIIDFEFDLTVDNLRFFAGAARTLQAQAAGEYLEDHTSMLRRDPSGSAPASPRGTTRSTWPPGSWARPWPPATRSSSSRRS